MARAADLQFGGLVSHQAVGGDEDGREDLDEGGVVPDPHWDSGALGDARLQPAEELALTDVVDSGGLDGQEREALRTCRVWSAT